MSDVSAMNTVEMPTHRPSRGRSVIAVLCLVLAGVLFTPAAVAYWGHRTLTDTERYVQTVGPLVSSPAVQDAIATAVISALEKQVDVEALLTTALADVVDDRPRLEMLIGPIAGAVNGLIEREVREFLASDAFEDLWVAINTRAQQGLMRLLEGESVGAISLQGNQVVLDVSEVIERVRQRLVDRGLTMLQNVPIPDIDKQIVLLESEELAQLRTIYAFANPISRWALPVVGLLFLTSILVAVRRSRMTVAVGAVILANTLLVAFALDVGRQVFVNQLSDTVFGPASTVFYEQLLAYLRRGLRVFAWLSLFIIVAGLLTGGSRWATAVRRGVAGPLESLGAHLPAEGTAPVGRWAVANAAWLRIVALVIGVVVLLWGADTSVSRLWWSLALVLALLVILQVLVGAGRRTSHTSLPQESGTGGGPDSGTGSGTGTSSGSGTGTATVVIP